MTTDKIILSPPCVKLKGQTAPNCGMKHVGEKKVLCTNVSRSKDKQDVYNSITIDLDGLSQEEIEELASKSILIGWIRKSIFLKSSSKSIIDNYHGSTIKAVNHRPERSTTQPEDKVVKQLSKMDKNRHMKFLTTEMGLSEEEAQKSWEYFCKNNGLRVSDGQPIGSDKNGVVKNGKKNTTNGKNPNVKLRKGKKNRKK